MSLIPATVRAYFATPDTHTFPMVMLVPTWVVSGPHAPSTPTPDDLALCAVGVTGPVYGGALPDDACCDFCPKGDPALVDENGSVYCLLCAMPGGGTYGLVQSKVVEFVPWDEATGLPERTPTPEPADELASL